MDGLPIFHEEKNNIILWYEVHKEGKIVASHGLPSHKGCLVVNGQSKIQDDMLNSFAIQWMVQPSLSSHSYIKFKNSPR